MEEARCSWWPLPAESNNDPVLPSLPSVRVISPELDKEEEEEEEEDNEVEKGVARDPDEDWLNGVLVEEEEELLLEFIRAPKGPELDIEATFPDEVKVEEEEEVGKLSMSSFREFESRREDLLFEEGEDEERKEVESEDVVEAGEEVVEKVLRMLLDVVIRPLLPPFMCDGGAAGP